MPYKEDIFVFEIHFPVMILELFVFIFSFLIATVILLKWRERRTVATLYLSVALYSLSFAVFFAFSGVAAWFFDWSTSGFPRVNSPAYYPVSLPLGYSMVIVYDIFLFLFTIQIFLDKDNKKIIPVILVGIIMGSLLWLPANYWGVDPSMLDPPSTRTMATGIYMIYNVIIYVILSHYAFRESKQTEEREYQVGFQAIAIGQITNIMIFVFFLLDSIMLMLDPGSMGFSIFIYLGWISAFVAIFLFYIGFILPQWFRNLL